MAVVTKAAYDTLERSCKRLTGDCSAALEAKDRELAAKDSIMAALRARQLATDSLLAIELARRPLLLRKLASRCGVSVGWGVARGGGEAVVGCPVAR